MNVDGINIKPSEPNNPINGNTSPLDSNKDPVRRIIEGISNEEWQNICNRYSVQTEIFERPAWTQTLKDLKGYSQSDQQKQWSVYLNTLKVYESTTKHNAGDKICIFVFNESSFNRKYKSSDDLPPLGTLYSAKEGSYIRNVWRGIDFSLNPPIKILTDDIKLLSTGQNAIKINGFSFILANLNDASIQELRSNGNLINHTTPANYFYSTISEGAILSYEERKKEIGLITDELKIHEAMITRLIGLDKARFFRELEVELVRKKDEGLASKINTTLLQQWLNKIYKPV